MFEPLKSTFRTVECPLSLRLMTICEYASHVNSKDCVGSTRGADIFLFFVTILSCINVRFMEDYAAYWTRDQPSGRLTEMFRFLFLFLYR